MSIGHQHLPPSVEAPSPLAGIAGAMGPAEDFGSNEVQQQLMLAQVLTTNGVKKPVSTPTPRPTPTQPRPAPRPRRA